MSASAKGKQQKYVRQLQCQEQCIEHIPYCLSGLSRAHFSDNLSRNNCKHFGSTRRANSAKARQSEHARVLFTA